MKPLTALELIKNFDQLPDDAVVPDRVTCLILGVSEWTFRRDPPKNLRRVPLSARRVGRRVGDIRAFVRGTATVNA